jgi:hypothetical protein
MTIRRRAILLTTLATATVGWPLMGGAQTQSQSQASVNDFLALSARLTGFPVSELSAGVGAMLLQSFQTQGTLKGPKFNQEIIAAWYSGISQTPAGPVVVTHQEALVWRSAGFLHPPGQCGGAFGYWSTPPAPT